MNNQLRFAGLVILVVIFIGIGLAAALGGRVTPQTIRISEGASLVHPLYGELQSNPSIGYREDFSGWHLTDVTPDVEPVLISENDRLILKGIISNASTPTTAGMIKDAKVDIASFSVLEVNLVVSEGIHYGLRFFGLYSNSTMSKIWWEGSPLDHRLGVGREQLRVNMARQAFLATGRDISPIVRLEIYVESRPSNPTTFTLELESLQFASYQLTSMVEHQQYRAVYIDMNAENFSGPWSLYRIQLGVSLDADPDTSFEFLQLKGHVLYTTSVTPIVYKYSSFVRNYDIAFYPSQSDGIFPEMLPKSNVSMVVVAVKGALTSVRLGYLDLIYLPSQETSPDLSVPLLGSYYVYFLFFLFLVPVGLAIIVYHEFFQRQSIARLGVWIVLIVGLTCRFALAPMTSHPFDMKVLLTSVRGWFQYGSARVSQGPTLPLTFFVYWIPYSFYALLQKAGLKDFFLPWGVSGVFESLFIKMFPITADVLVYMALLLFKKGGKSLVWATFFFLNPLVIFASAITGHYDSALLFLVLIGSIWLSSGKTIRAGAAFVASSLLQLLGFVPYLLTITKMGLDRGYRLSLILVSVGLLTLVYPPQRELSFRILLSILGVTNSSQFSAGEYTLLGSFGLTELVSKFHILLVVGGLILICASVDTARKPLQASTIPLYTCVSALAFLLLLNLPSEWIWLIPVGLLYASMVDNSKLGVYILPFGTASCFFLVSLVGSAYYLLGSNSRPILGSIEGARNGLLIFNLITTVLGALFFAYLQGSKSNTSHTLIRSSVLIIGAYVTFYFWVGVFVS